MTRVLVTGDSGRIGRRVVRRLMCEPDLEVVTLHSLDRPHERVDLADLDRVGSATARLVPDAVFHLGGTVSDSRSDAAAWRANVGSIAALLDGSRSASRFILASSAAVYGTSRDHALHEDDPPRWDSLNGEQKWRAEEELFAHSVPGLAAVSLRIFNVFGPGMERSLVNRLLSTSASKIELAGWSQFVRDYVHVDDVAEAFLSALRAPLDAGPLRVNIARGEPTSNEALIRSLGDRRIADYSLVAQTTSWSWATIDAARDTLGWRPRRGLIKDDTAGAISD